MADNELTITIDGKQIKTRPGKMLLEAAIEAGIYIPYLCYHPGMKPYGACRMCVVEIEGGRGYQASCTVPVQDGMVVKTRTQPVEQVRRTVMELLLAEHPHGCLTCHRIELCGPQDICLRHVAVTDRCVTCPKNERCEFKDTTRYHTMDLESPLNYKYRSLPLETSDPFYDRDYNLCIVCGRCVRACVELRGDDAITFTERSGKALVGTAFGTSLLESGCEFCGACVDVCPVGALVEKDYKWEKAERVVHTVCNQCPVGCQLNLEVNRFGKVIRAIPELNAPANRGQACYKGKFGMDFINRKERLRKPLVRKNGQLVESTWDEALGLVAEKLRNYKGDQFALVASAKCTNEELYLAQKFARAVMGSNNVDVSTNTRPDLAAPLAEMLGYAGATNTIWELDRTRCVLAFNTNVTEEQNVVAVPVKRVARASSKLIVIDPREVELTRYADIWLRPRPGTEPLLLAGLLKAVMDQGLVKQDWVAQHCEGLDSLAGSLKAVDLEAVAKETGVARKDIEAAARTFATSETSAIIYGLDNIPPELHKACTQALANLSLLTGQIGRPSTGLYPLRQGTNEQGAWDVGCVPHLLPGYRPVADPQARRKVEQAWAERKVPANPGLGLREMVQAAASGGIKAMMVVGDNAHLFQGELGNVGEALKKLEFLVVQDIFLRDAAHYADVVLPEVTFAEKTGTYTNLERRIQPLHQAIEVKNSEAKPVWWVLSRLARRLKVEGLEYSSPNQITQEMARVTPIYGGVSLERLEAEAVITLRPPTDNPLPNQVLNSDKWYPGLQWPVPEASHKGTPILYAEGFPNGRARLMPVRTTTAKLSANGHGMLLVPGRVLLQSEREIKIVHGKLNRIQRDEQLEVHPQDAQRLGLAQGDAVEVEIPQGRVKARVVISEKVYPGHLYITYLFGQLAVELEASEDPDPMARVPGLVITPARVVKAGR